MQPTIGRIVHYKLGEQDAQLINATRDAHNTGNAGNQARAGDVYPAMVVRVFDPSVTTANLQVFLDGNDTYWATSRTEGDEPCHWVWPPRA